MGASDPTLEFLDGLNDPALYSVKENVPVFVAHTRKFKDRKGKTHEITVTESDLKEIMDDAVRREKETGTPWRLTLGHMKPDADENEQPDIIGAASNYRMGTFGPEKKTALLCSHYIRKDRLAEVRKGGYNYRSCEYYPNRKQITGVALLKRDPELDLGMVAYHHTITVERPGGGLLCYSAEVHMADPTDPPDPTVSALPPPANPDPDDAEREDFMRTMAMHPYMKKCAAKYAAMPSPTNMDIPGGIPGGGGDNNPATPYAGTDEAVAAYARTLEARLKRAEQRSARAEQANLILVYQGELADLATEQGLDEAASEEFVAKELPRVQSYSRQQFDAYKEVLADHLSYSRDPTQGAMLPVARTSKAKELTEARLEEAQVYMRQGMKWEEARAKVLAG